jgi:hypothetical protein
MVIITSGVGLLQGLCPLPPARSLFEYLDAHATTLAEASGQRPLSLSLKYIWTIYFLQDVLTLLLAY